MCVGGVSEGTMRRDRCAGVRDVRISGRGRYRCVGGAVGKVDLVGGGCVLRGHLPAPSGHVPPERTRDNEAKKCLLPPPFMFHCLLPSNLTIPNSQPFSYFLPLLSSSSPCPVLCFLAPSSQFSLLLFRWCP